MKQWQGFVNEHVHMEVIDNNTIKVYNSSWNLETGEHFNDIVKRNDDGSYQAETFSQDTNELVDTVEYESIKYYLGY